MSAARVVVGYCRSAAGDRALRYAVGLARLHACPLYVVDVRRPATGGPAPRPIPLADPERLAEARRTQMGASLHRVAGELLAEVDVRLAVLEGHPWFTPDRLADRPGDRLVLAGRGRWAALRCLCLPRRHGRAATLAV